MMKKKSNFYILFVLWQIRGSDLSFQVLKEWSFESKVHKLSSIKTSKMRRSKTFKNAFFARSQFIQIKAKFNVNMKTLIFVVAHNVTSKCMLFVACNFIFRQFQAQICKRTNLAVSDSWFWEISAEVTLKSQKSLRKTPSSVQKLKNISSQNIKKCKNLSRPSFWRMRFS